MHEDLFLSTLRSYLGQGVQPENGNPAPPRSEDYQLRVDETEALVGEALREMASYPAFAATFGAASPEISRDELWTTIRYSDPDAAYRLEAAFGMDGDAPDMGHIVLDLEIRASLDRGFALVNADREVSRGASADFWCSSPVETAEAVVKEVAIGIGMAIAALPTPEQSRMRVEAGIDSPGEHAPGAPGR